MPPCSAMPFRIEPIACSRMPKCRVRPYGSPWPHASSRSLGGQERRLALHRGVVGLGEVGRAAPQLGQHAASALSTSPDASRVATPLAGLEVGSASVQPSGSSPARSRSNRAARSGLAGRHASKRSSHSACGAAAAVDDLAGVREHLVGDLEVCVRVEAEHLLGRGDLVGAERRAVGLAGVLRVRRRPADDRAQRDERRAGRSRRGPRSSAACERRRRPRGRRRRSSRRAARASRTPRSARRRPR